MYLVALIIYIVPYFIIMTVPHLDRFFGVSSFALCGFLLFFDPVSAILACGVVDFPSYHYR